MSDHDHGSPFIQHHFDGAKHQFDSGKLGIWAFLAQEILFFSALFVAYIVYRTNHPELYFFANHYLDTTMGAINTAVLIVSSLTAAWAVRCAQLNQKRGLQLTLLATILCAFGFLTIKYFEYSHKIHEGILFGAKFNPVKDPFGKAYTLDGYIASAASQHPVVASPDEERNLLATKHCERIAYFEPKNPTMIKDPIDASKEIVWVAPGKTPTETEKDNPRESCGALARHMATFIANKRKELASDQAQLAKFNDQYAPVEKWLNGKNGQPILVAGIYSGYSGDPGAKVAPPNTNMFFSIYFAMTGLHGIHVVAGIILFIWLFLRSRKEHFNENYFGPIDYAALYWHLVDLIWIFLFPMLYLIH